VRETTLRRRPSPALVVACLALFVSLSGVAWAATAGRNTVNSTSIRNGQVKNVDLAANAVTGSKIKNGQVASADVRDNALGGVDIDEATLTGVAGLDLRKINYRAASSAPVTDILNLGGLVLRASCTAGGNVSVNAHSTVDNAAVQSVFITDGGQSQSADDPDFDPIDSLDIFGGLVAAQRAENSGTIVYATSDGHVVTVTWRTAEAAGSNPCGFSAIAVGS
jgi:hypothetical protein